MLSTFETFPNEFKGEKEQRLVLAVLILYHSNKWKTLNFIPLIKNEQSSKSFSIELLNSS